MAAGAAEILPRHNLSPIEVDRLEQRLYDHNRHETGRDDGRTLAFIAVDTRGAQIGAIAGYSWAGMAEIKQLWVDEDHRGIGIGRTFLEAAIAEAMNRRCQYVWALSYEFQAPDCTRSVVSIAWSNSRTGLLATHTSCYAVGLGEGSLVAPGYACAAQGWYWTREQQAELLRDLPGPLEPIERDLGPAIAAVWALYESNFKDACVMDWTPDEAAMELISRPQVISLAGGAVDALPLVL